MDWVYLDTSRTDQERLWNGMERLLNHTSEPETYSPACSQILQEYTCILNFPSCDLSHPTPRPILVSWLYLIGPPEYPAPSASPIQPPDLYW